MGAGPQRCEFYGRIAVCDQRLQRGVYGCAGYAVSAAGRFKNLGLIIPYPVNSAVGFLTKPILPEQILQPDR